MSGFRTPDLVTYWLEGTKDGKGSQSWEAPVVLNAFVALKTKELTSPEGKLVMSSHSIYARILLPIGTYIAIGDQSATADPSDVVGSKKVIVNSNTGSMSDMSKMWI